MIFSWLEGKSRNNMLLQVIKMNITQSKILKCSMLNFWLLKFQGEVMLIYISNYQHSRKCDVLNNHGEAATNIPFYNISDEKTIFYSFFTLPLRMLNLDSIDISHFFYFYRE